ncbi:bacterial group 3 Ig-like protein [Lentilactobacillus sunkii DSM 19904]|uniref:Bacterial group 3 Ig-like protein n=2 Tax=Lentilactobacillus sunkii TaxID=481719 RepID=A0A0R1KUP6_9LACO|nr:bacterial group 3 Ig-like protein [Lentilactobacillus sunkii DSM 19904]
MVAVVAAFVVVGILSGGEQHASAATPNMLTTKIWITGTDSNGSVQTIAQQRVNPDGQFNHVGNLDAEVQPINTDKYSNFVAHYSVINNSGNALRVEPILGLPWVHNWNTGGTLIYNSSQDIKWTNTNGTSTLTPSYSYSPNINTYTATDQKSDNLAYIAYGGPIYNGHPTYQTLNNGASLQIDIPLKVAANTNWSASNLAHISDLTYVGNDGDTNPDIHLQLRPVHTMDVQDFPSANLNTLNSTDKYNGINHLYKSDGTEETDHTKATVKIEPTADWNKYKVTYTYDGVSKTVTATISSKAFIDTKDFTVAYGSKWDLQKFGGITTLTDPNGNAIKPSDSNVTISSIKDSAGNTVTSVDTSKAGSVYTVTYTYNGVSKPVKVTVGKPGVNPVRPVNPTTPVNPTPVTPTNPNWNPSKPGDLNGTGLPNYAAVKGSAVYSTKGIYMYKNANFKKSQRMAYYPKVKRVNRHMFVVLGYDRSNGGALRYKVRDVNHGKKTAGKVGYITANRKYVVNVYYKGMPKSNKITVISKKGVHSYKNKNLTGRTGTYKKGTHLRVKDIVKHNLTTRYQLTNGDYVTANKKLVIQGTY